ITARKRFEDQQSLLIIELDHHVKNLLARVAAVAKDMREDSGSLDDYVQALDRRIRSMAGAHALLSQSRWDGSTSPNSFAVSLRPTERTETRRSEGHIALPVAATQVLAMVLQQATERALRQTETVMHGATTRCGRLPPSAIQFVGAVSQGRTEPTRPHIGRRVAHSAGGDGGGRTPDALFSSF